MRRALPCLWLLVHCSGPSDTDVFRPDDGEETPAGSGGAASGTSMGGSTDGGAADVGAGGAPDAEDGGAGPAEGRGGRAHSPPNPSFGGAEQRGGAAGAEPTPTAGQPDEPEPDPDTVAPEIVSVSPADGARGVHAQTAVVITFSEPMDRTATEAAFASDVAALANGTFSWNGAGTVLTVEPTQPLPYAEVATLTEPPLTIGIELGEGARDLAGNPLAPRAFSFSTFRRYTEELLPNQALSGSLRSDGTPGLGDCAPTQSTICVGDSYYEGAFVQYKGFVSFPLEAPSEAAAIESARLRLRVRNTSETKDGAVIQDPFGELGALLVEPVRYAGLGAAAFDAQALAEARVFATAATPGAVLAGVVPLDDEALARDALQLRLAFESENNGVPEANAIVFDAPSSRLDVTYLVP